MSKIVVLIVDSQQIFRAGVRRALSHQNGLENLEILDCDPGTKGEEAIRQTAEHSPNVVLLDIDCPPPGGLELCRHFTKHFPASKVVMLSGHHNAEELFEVIKTGAAAYLSKDSDVEELYGVIKRVSSGEYPINDSFNERPAVATRVLDQFQELASTVPVKDDIVPPLTTREIQFLNLIAEENSNKQIAAILGISEQEIKDYVSVILRKLNAGDRAHSVMMSLCNHWLAIQNGENGPQSGDYLPTEPVLLENPPKEKHPSRAAPKTKKRGSNKAGRAPVMASDAKGKS